jgi:NTE family protein
MKPEIKEIDTLNICGGGSKDLAMIGTLTFLEENNVLENITNFAGSSAGAIIVSLLNIGYTSKEIKDTVFSQNSKIVYDSVFKIPFNLYYNYGLFSASKMVAYIESLFVLKNYSKDVTFKELNIKTNKILTLTGTSLNERDTLYFNHHTMPDMKVVDAIHISMSIPIFFTSVKYTINDKLHNFVDGGLLMNLPLYYYNICKTTSIWFLSDKDLAQKEKLLKIANTQYTNKTIGIILFDAGDTKDLENLYTGHDIINNISQFFMSLIDTVTGKIQIANYTNPLTGVKENFFDETIVIELPIPVSAIDFNFPQKTKDILIEA